MLRIRAKYSRHTGLMEGRKRLSSSSLPEIEPRLQCMFFGFDLDAADLANQARLIDLGRLNEWRNVVAHHNAVPPGGLPSQADLQRWRNSCDGLAASFDGIMSHELQGILGNAPWVP